MPRGRHRSRSVVDMTIQPEPRPVERNQDTRIAEGERLARRICQPSGVDYSRRRPSGNEFLLAHALLDALARLRRYE